MKKIALVTCKSLPNLWKGDKLLISPLIENGFDIHILPWDDRHTDWKKFDIVVLRSTWDYHFRIREFLSWIESLKRKRVNLWNKPETVLWNINKKYLLDLEKKGVFIIPTKLIPINSSYKRLADSILNAGWEKMVIKPSYGASAYKIIVLNMSELGKYENILERNLQQSDLLVQPYIDEIQKKGEYSFLFYGGKFSHAVLKKPAKNDFRTQREFGGKENEIIPQNEILQQAANILSVLKWDTLYARVDGIVLNRNFYLMELELVEPELFFEKSKEAVNNFIVALKDITCSIF